MSQFDHSLDSSVNHLNHLNLLSFSFENQRYDSLIELVEVVNFHVDSQDYIVVLARIKCLKKEIKRKTFLRCDRERKAVDLREKKRVHDFSRLINCSFSVTVRLEEFEK
jgi:hypothetical protein